ncbi:MAG: restriction endonuclease subunit S [Candidatus Diapherotrites archaeon]
METEIKTLREVADYINGRAFKPSEWGKKGLPIIRIQNLTNSTDVVNYYAGDYEKKHLIKNGDLLLAWSATLDIFIWDEGDALLNQHIFKVIPNEKIIKKNYFYYLIKHILEDIKKKTHGTGMTHITKPKLLEIEVPVPSLPVQEKIVAKLDAFFEKYDEMKKENETVKKQHAEIMQKAISGLMHYARDLPAGWSEKPLGELVKVRKDKIDPKKEKITNYVGFEHIESKKGRVITQIKNPDLKSTKNKFFPGDVVYGKLRPYLNKTFYADFSGAVSTDLIPLIPSEEIEGEYLFYLLLSDRFVSFASANTSGVQLPRTSFQKISKYAIRFPPKSEQKKIVCKLTEIKSKGELIESEIKKMESQLYFLPKSVLVKAFSGELVS